MDNAVWERLDRDTARLSVPGGWLVRVYVWGTNCVALHTVFVADADHSWRLQ